EYFSPSQQVWLPFASFERNGTGAVVAPTAPVLQLGIGMAPIEDAPGITHSPGEPLFGTSIPSNVTAHWGIGLNVTLTAAQVTQLFAPPQAAGYRVVFQVDTTAATGTPSVGSGAGSNTAQLAGVDGILYSPTMKVTIDTAAPAVVA